MAVSLQYLGDVIGGSSHLGQCPRCDRQFMSTHDRVLPLSGGQNLCERCVVALEKKGTWPENWRPLHPRPMRENAHKAGTYPAQRARYVVTVRHASGAEDPSFTAGELGDTPVDVAHRAAQVLHGTAYIRVFDRETKVSLMYRAADGDVTHISTSETRMRFPQQTPNARETLGGRNWIGLEVLAFMAELSADDREHKRGGPGKTARVRRAAQQVLSGDRHAAEVLQEEAKRISYGGTLGRALKRSNAEAITIAELILQTTPAQAEAYASSEGMYAANRAHTPNVHKMGKSQHRNGASPETAPILNPDDYENGALVRLCFGAYGETCLYYWASSVDAGIEEGFEAAVEWLDEHAPGMLTTIGPDDYIRAAEEEGIQWNPAWPDFNDPDFERVVQAAEADMTMIGHTTLEHGNAVPSYEWTAGEASPEEYEVVLRRAAPYVYKMTYDIVTPESAEEGDVAESGWELEESEPMSLEDLVREVNDHNWLEWSSSNPRGKGDWLISDSEVEDYGTGAEKTYNLFIERVDGQPLSAEEIKEISKELGVSTYGMMMPNASGSDKVLRAAESGRYANAGAFHTAGGVIYSYDLPIADLRKEPFLVVSKDSLDAAGKLTVTTSKHIGFVMRGLPKNLIRVVDYGVVRDAVLTKNRRR